MKVYRIQKTSRKAKELLPFESPYLEKANGVPRIHLTMAQDVDLWRHILSVDKGINKAEFITSTYNFLPPCGDRGLGILMEWYLEFFHRQYINPIEQQAYRELLLEQGIYDMLVCFDDDNSLYIQDLQLLSNEYLFD